MYLNFASGRQNGFDFVENESAPPGRRLQLSAVPFSKNITFGIGGTLLVLMYVSHEHDWTSRVLAYRASLTTYALSTFFLLRGSKRVVSFYFIFKAAKLGRCSLPTCIVQMYRN